LVSGALSSGIIIAGSHNNNLPAILSKKQHTKSLMSTTISINELEIKKTPQKLTLDRFDTNGKLLRSGRV
jgi:hypothetical protein